MRYARGRGVRGFVVALAACSLAAPAGADAPHPALAKVDGGLCANCHEGMLEGGGSVHAPAADDCTSCHEMTLGKGEARVSLAAGEPDLCVLCHDDLSGAAGGELEVSHMPVVDGCTTCHDPHASERITLLLDDVTALCGACHDSEEVKRGHGGQTTGATRCVSCHVPHGSDHEHMLRAADLHRPFADGSCNACHREPFGDRIRLRARGARLCEACHGEFAPGDAGGTLHAALADEGGRAGCLQCHDPHLSEHGRLLTKDGMDLCRSCHGEIAEAAGAETGHAAAADDCLTCHAPHVSERRALLDEPAVTLCTMCHDTGDEDLAAAHLGRSLDGLDCTACHDPHGTGNDSLLAVNVHAPLADGCDTCHEGPAGELVDDGESTLCLICHDDVGETAAAATVPHAALEVARCADCHNPHASAQDNLLAFPAGGECVQCHDEQSAGENEVAHGIITLVGCRACHEPHGGDREKLLRAEAAELCLGCHRAGSVETSEAEGMAVMLGRFEIPEQVARATASLKLSEDDQNDHPIRGHRVSGVPTEKELKRTDASFRDELSCLTCHDPHKGRSRLLLRWGGGSSMEACAHCHSRK